MGVLIAFFLLMAVSGIAYIFYKRYRSLLVTYSHDQKEIAALRSILALNQQVLQSKLLLDLCCGTDYRKEGIVKSIAFLKLEERLKCVSVVLIQVPVSIQLFYNLHKSEFSDAQKNLLHTCQTASDKYFPSYWLWENPGTIVGILDMSKTHSDDIRLLGMNKLGVVLQSVCAAGNDKPPIIAFGTITSSIEELHHSYSAAAELLNHKIHNHLIGKRSLK